MKRAKVIYLNKYKKGAITDNSEVVKLLTREDCKVETEILEDGDLEDGTEFITVKIFAKKV